MVIFPLAPNQTTAQMWSNGARGGFTSYQIKSNQFICQKNKINTVDRTPRKVKPSLTDAPNNRIGITHKHDHATTRLVI